ncbi:TPA: hypothetical protein ACN4Y7_002823 [Staphylococcus aureus]
MNQLEIEEFENALEEQNPHLKDIKTYSVDEVAIAANKSKATILRKLRDPKIVEQLAQDLKTTKNNRGVKKYIFTLQGVRKLVAIINGFELKKLDELNMAELQKLTNIEEKEDITEEFKNIIKQKGGRHWNEIYSYFANKVEPEIFKLKQRNEIIAHLKEDNKFLNDECKSQYQYIKQQKQIIADKDEINDLLREKIDSILAYQDLKKDINK